MARECGVVSAAVLPIRWLGVGLIPWGGTTPSPAALAVALRVCPSGIVRTETKPSVSLFLTGNGGGWGRVVTRRAGDRHDTAPPPPLASHPPCTPQPSFSLTPRAGAVLCRRPHPRPSVERAPCARPRAAATSVTRRRQKRKNRRERGEKRGGGGEVARCVDFSLTLTRGGNRRGLPQGSGAHTRGGACGRHAHLLFRWLGRGGVSGAHVGVGGVGTARDGRGRQGAPWPSEGERRGGRLFGRPTTSGGQRALLRVGCTPARTGWAAGRGGTPKEG